MNYMKMVCFKELSQIDGMAQFIFKDNEDINFLDKPIIVPYFLILEGIFQTAGKVAREYTNNRYGAYIVSFRDFNFKRPVLSNEMIEIRSKLEFYNDGNKCFFLEVSVYKEDEVIIDNGKLILKQDKTIKNDYLNNFKIQTMEEELKSLGF